MKKFTLILIGVFFATLFVFGQQKQITLNLNNVTVKEALEALKTKGGYSYWFDAKDLNVSQKVTINVVNKTIDEVLALLFKDQKVEYKIKNGHIVINKSVEKVIPVQKKNELKKVSGIVLDEKGLPVIGASVMIPGTRIGVITDVNGQFSLEAPINAKIRVSYIGYQAKEEQIKVDSSLKISLDQTPKNLDEVVVVGYGTQKKISVTGAISSVGNDLLVKSPNASISNTLAGRVTGLSTVQYSGQPGGDEPIIFVRGIGSLTSDASSPLMLVDGVERAFSQLDPNEVESISVLKDASATAVYGIRGANGVIIVTTKRGIEGKPKINMTISSGLQAPTRLIEMADSYTYALKYNEAQRNDGITEDKLMFSPQAIKAFETNSNTYLYPNTNWVKEIIKPVSLQSQYNINISGGNNIVKYFVSLGYLNQDGQFNTFNVKDSYNFGYQRYNYRSNVDLQMTKTTTLAFTTGGRTEIRQQPGAPAYDGTFPVLYASVPFSGSVQDGKLYITGQNEIGMTELAKHNGATAIGWNTGYQKATLNILNLDIQLTQKLDFITKGLNWRVKYSNNSTVGFTKVSSKSPAEYTPVYLTNVPGVNLGKGDSSIVFTKIRNEGIMNYSESSQNAKNWYFESAFTYDNTFGNHHLTGLLLYNQSKIYYPAIYTDIPSGYVGIAGRATYSYKQKYLVDINLGYNGSENFAPDKRFGLFPAVSAGWVISEEKFMKDKIPFLDFLKLRFSYGEVGNDKQGNYRFLYMPDSYIYDMGGASSSKQAAVGGYSFGVNDPTWRTTAAEGKIGNPGVTWEKAKKSDGGIDLWLFSGKFQLTTDIFFENRNNILTMRNTVPILLSFNLPVVNIGEVENHGFEAEIKWKDKIGEVNYYITTNVSYSKNKILYMDEVYRTYDYQYQTGHSVNQPFGYVFTGFWSANEVTHYNDLDNNGKRIYPDYLYIPKAGDCKYADLNGDAKINSDDQKAIGLPDYPEYNGSLSLGISYKGFDLSTMWTGATNVSRMMNSNWRVAFGSNQNAGLYQWLADNSWTPETAATAMAPRMSFTSSDNNTKISTLWQHDASYVRLKNIEIGYSFGNIKKFKISNLRVFANGYNLLTFDKIKFIDPESNTSSANYPLISIYNVGINVNF